MKIYLIGVGGVGGFYGGMLARSGADITFVSRGESFRAIKDGGLILNLQSGQEKLFPVKVIEHISEISEPDLVVLAVKSYNLEEVSSELSGVIKKDTIVITLQNGLDNDLVVAKTIDCQVLPGIVYVASTKVSPNAITQKGSQKKFCFGGRDGVVTSKMMEVEETFKKAGVDVTVTKDIVHELWKKFLFVVSFSSATVAGMCPIGKALSDPVTLNIYKEVLSEAIFLGVMEGVAFEPDIFDITLNGALAFDPLAKSSLLVDLENYRQTEVEALQGVIIRLADKYGLEVPVTKAVYDLVTDCKDTLCGG